MPLLDGGLDLRGPHQIGLIGSCGPLVRDRNIVVRASDLMFGAITAAGGSARYTQSLIVRMLQTIGGSSRHSECVDVCCKQISFHSDIDTIRPSIPVITTLAGLGVTGHKISKPSLKLSSLHEENKPASRRTTTWASHWKSCKIIKLN